MALPTKGARKLGGKTNTKETISFIKCEGVKFWITALRIKTSYMLYHVRSQQETEAHLDKQMGDFNKGTILKVWGGFSPLKGSMQFYRTVMRKSGVLLGNKKWYSTSGP